MKNRLPEKHLLTLLFAFLAVALQQYAIFCRIGLTFDSYLYEFAARSFAQHQTLLIDDNGTPYTNWTPLFPLLLSVVRPQWLNTAALALTIILLDYLAQKHLKKIELRLAFMWCMVFGTPLLLNSVFVWSEAVFVALLVVHIFFTDKLLAATKPNKMFFYAVVVTSNLLYLQRNAGLFFILATCLLFLMKDKTWKHCFLFTFLSLFSFFVWQVRNLVFIDNAHDFRANVLVVSLAESIYFFLEIVSQWFVPNTVDEKWRLVGIIAFLIVFVGLVVRQKMFQNNLFFRINVVFLLFYAGFMFALRMNVREENERYWSVVYPIFLFLFFMAIDQWQISKKWLKFVFVALLIFWLLYPTLRSLKNVDFWHQNNCKIKT